MECGAPPYHPANALLPSQLRRARQSIVGASTQLVFRPFRRGHLDFCNCTNLFFVPPWSSSRFATSFPHGYRGEISRRRQGRSVAQCDGPATRDLSDCWEAQSSWLVLKRPEVLFRSYRRPRSLSLPFRYCILRACTMCDGDIRCESH